MRLNMKLVSALLHSYGRHRDKACRRELAASNEGASEGWCVSGR
jgi:hypothetical protein